MHADIDEILPIANGILRLATDHGVHVRLIGGIAFWVRCPGARRRALPLRRYKDIDLAALTRDKGRLEELLIHNCNLVPDSHIATIAGSGYSMFRRRSGEVVCEVSYDTLRYCHDIDFHAHLTVDPVTLPLAELFLSKLQIATAV